MPRPERPLDIADGVLAEFAADLRALRDQAGRPGYRKLATRAHYSATTLSDAAGGRDLPSLAVTLAYVRACDGDIAMWERRWHAVAARLATERPATEIDMFDRATTPYAGLAAFEPGDADRFFGRDDLTEELVRRVQERRFVAVFGASGAGKSSVLRAGLVARMRVAMPVLVLTPGQRPVEECAVAVAMLALRPAPDLRAELNADPDALHLQIRQALADRPDDTDLLLVVDQFEEVFTLCRDECERLRFVTALVRASQQPTSRLRVVLGVRTDFYTHCARIPELVDALRDAQVLVGSMNPTELRSAVSQPAVRAGCAVEGDLLAAVIADCAGESAVLPLLSHALLETWRRRRGNTLTLSGYQAAGGIAHAISHTADQVYEGFDDRSRQLAKSLFLRLTALGDGTEDTKRRLRRDELDSTGTDTTAVLERLAQARLITLDHEWVEITHEALIRCWPRLHDWLAADREGLRVHRQLTQAADTWLALDRDPDALYRGSRLATAQEWHTATDALLNVSEREFLTASLAAQASDRAATRRRTRRLRQLVALLSVLLLVAGVAVVVAVRAGQSATTQRDVAMAQTALLEANTLRTTDPALSLQLTLAAYRRRIGTGEKRPAQRARRAVRAATRGLPRRGRVQPGWPPDGDRRRRDHPDLGPHPPARTGDARCHHRAVRCRPVGRVQPGRTHTHRLHRRRGRPILGTHGSPAPPTPDHPRRRRLGHVQRRWPPPGHHRAQRPPTVGQHRSGPTGPAGHTFPAIPVGSDI